MSETPDQQGDGFNPSASMSTGEKAGPYEDDFESVRSATFNQYITEGPSADDIRRGTALEHAVRVVQGTGRNLDDVETVLKAAKQFDDFLSGGDSERLTYNDETMQKVYKALLQMPNATEADVVNAISLMQNDGILFREKA